MMIKKHLPSSFTCEIRKYKMNNFLNYTDIHNNEDGKLQLNTLLIIATILMNQ